MAEQDHRPEWLSEDCPPWCRREHHESDHPEDRIHQSEPTWVPVVLRRSPLLTHDDDPGEGAELMVQSSRAVGSDQIWVLICESEDTRSMLLLSLESARRLAVVLTEVVE